MDRDAPGFRERETAPRHVDSWAMSETDPTSIEELLSEERWLRSLAGGLVRGGDRADEVVQETWLAALTHPPERRGTARGWLATVARNAARQLLRRERRIARRERGSARREAIQDVAEAVARVELRRRLAQEVLALDEPFRGAIVLRFFEGRSPSEIAEALGVPAATVRTRIHRGLASPPFSPGVRVVTRNGARLQRLRRQTDARIGDSVFSSRHRRSGLRRSRKATPVGRSGGIGADPGRRGPPKTVRLVRNAG